MQYQIAFLMESGEFDVVGTFVADDDDEANDRAEANYPGQEWYVLRGGKNINA